jgi:hypothetical protein
MNKRRDDWPFRMGDWSLDSVRAEVEDPYLPRCRETPFTAILVDERYLDVGLFCAYIRGIFPDMQPNVRYLINVPLLY